MTLNDRIALVTGAASGIGLATLKALQDAGARVYLADIDAKKGREIANDLAYDCDVIDMDISNRASVDAGAKIILEKSGRLDILVNAAGWGRVQPFLENDDAFIDQVVGINLLGTINVARSFLPGMIAAGSGKIVNVSSDAGRVGSFGETVYSGAKGGVIAFTKSLARETARHGITVNCVCPGPTDTPLLNAVPEKHRELLRRAIPMKRFAKPAEVADAIIFFSGPQSDYVTGQVLSVSGGLTMVD